MKVIKDKFENCSCCNKFFSTTNLKTHRRNPQSHLSYISNRGFVVKIMLNDSTSNVSKCNAIFINPVAVSQLSLIIFDTVSITYKKSSVICVLFPDENVALDEFKCSQFVFDNLNVSPGKFVLIDKFYKPLQIAKSCNFKISCNKVDNVLADYVRFYTDGLIISVGSTIKFEFEDKIFKLELMSINDALPKPNVSISSLEEISEMFNELSLNANNSFVNNVEVLSNSTIVSDNLNRTIYKDYLVENNPFFQIVNSQTRIKITSKSQHLEGLKFHDSKLEETTKIFGYDVALDALYKMICLPLTYTKETQNSGFVTLRGMVLYGARGVGKTSIIKQLCNSSKLRNYWIDIAVINSFDSPVEEIKELFFNLHASEEPTILVIENLEKLFPKDKKYILEDLSEISGVLLAEMKKCNNSNLFIVGTTQDIDSIDVSQYDEGLMDMEYEILIPNSEQRFKIITGILQSINNDLKDFEIEYIVSRTSGFVPRDLILLFKFASIESLVRYHKLVCDLKEPVTTSVSLDIQDFLIALCKVKPSSIKCYSLDVPKIKWRDIGGMDEVKQDLIESIIWPLNYPQKLQLMGIHSSNGVLLYGPPGCSKTMMARALAGESNINFISIRGPELLNKYVGETEKSIRELFKRARLVAPCILFFDEIDSIASKRSHGDDSSHSDKILAQLLTEMDGITGGNINVFILAATNRPNAIDHALLRPGRFDRLVYVPLPDKFARKEILTIQLRLKPVHVEVDIINLVQLTDGYTGAEICALCKEAAYCALREDIEATKIRMKHFESVLKVFKPRILKDVIKMYDNYKNNITN